MLSHPYLPLGASAAHSAASLYSPFASPLLALPSVANSTSAALYHSTQPLPHSHTSHPYPTPPIASATPTRASISGSQPSSLISSGSSSHSHSHSHPLAAHATAMGGSLPLTMPLHSFAAQSPASAVVAGSAAGMSSSLYAYGLPSALTDSDLHDLFGIYGGVSSVHIMRNDNGTPKGYAFINMKSVHDAAVAQLYLDHFPIGGRTLRVHFKRMASQQQHHQPNSGKHRASTASPNTQPNGATSSEQQQQQQQQQQQHEQQVSPQHQQHSPSSSVARSDEANSSHTS